MFTNITKPHNLVVATIVGNQAMKFEFDSGKVLTVVSLIWSTMSTNSDNPEPTEGKVNFFQGGGVSGPGTYGQTVSEKYPITFLQNPGVTSQETTITNNSGAGYIDADASGTLSAGDTVTYTYTVTNTGTNNLKDVVVTDSQFGKITLSSTSIPAGGSVTGTFDYILGAGETSAPITTSTTTYVRDLEGMGDTFTNIHDVTDYLLTHFNNF